MSRSNVIGWVVVLSAVSSVAALAQQPEQSPKVLFHVGGYGAYNETALGPSYGLGAVVEPKYRLVGDLLAGVRVEFNARSGVVGRAEFGLGSLPVSMLGLTAGVIPKLEYGTTLGEYFKPFIGLGAGVYGVIGDGVFAAFGVVPQLGVDMGRVRLAVTYDGILGHRDYRIAPDYVAVELSGRL